MFLGNMLPSVAGNNVAPCMVALKVACTSTSIHIIYYKNKYNCSTISMTVSCLQKYLLGHATSHAGIQPFSLSLIAAVCSAFFLFN